MFHRHHHHGEGRHCAGRHGGGRHRHGFGWGGRHGRGFGHDMGDGDMMRGRRMLAQGDLRLWRSR